MAKKTATDKADKADKTEKGSTSGEKGAGDKTPVENTKENDEQPVELEPYTPTGNFEADFCELCTRAGFPTMQVVSRPHRPPTPSVVPQDSTPVAKQDKKDADKSKDDSSKTDEAGTVSGGETEEPPTTYTTKEKYHYFKPRVEVETEEEGNKSHIKEIYIRGWKIDERILNILTITLPPLEKLTTIDFWNTGLQDNSLNTLAIHVITHLPNLRTLCLDNNPVTLQRYGVFLGEESTIQNLSLRNCYVNDMGAKMIGRALTANKSLMTLNLCYNKITCEGAAFIAKGLRMNRTLLSLNLGSNLIADNGASKLAEVLSSFALSHEEVVARRLLISKKNPEETSPSRNLNAPTGGSKDRPASVRSGTHVSKEDKKSREKKDSQKKKDNKKQETEKAKKIASTEALNKSVSKGKKVNTTKGDKKLQQPEQEQPEVVEFPNPLLEIPLKEESGEIIIPGNRALINLNLSRNKVGVTGVEAFLISIQRQADVSSSAGKPTGLMRFLLSRNLFSPENPSYLRLVELMQTRDPFYKPPQPSPVDETGASTKDEA